MHGIFLTDFDNLYEELNRLYENRSKNADSSRLYTLFKDIPVNDDKTFADYFLLGPTLEQSVKRSDKLRNSIVDSFININNVVINNGHNKGITLKDGVTLDQANKKLADLTVKLENNNSMYNYLYSMLSYCEDCYTQGQEVFILSSSRAQYNTPLEFSANDLQSAYSVVKGQQNELDIEIAVVNKVKENWRPCIFSFFLEAYAIYWRCPECNSITSVSRAIPFANHIVQHSFSCSRHKTVKPLPLELQNQLAYVERIDSDKIFPTQEFFDKMPPLIRDKWENGPEAPQDIKKAFETKNGKLINLALLGSASELPLPWQCPVHGINWTSPKAVLNYHKKALKTQAALKNRGAGDEAAKVKDYLFGCSKCATSSISLSERLLYTWLQPLLADGELRAQVKVNQLGVPLQVGSRLNQLKSIDMVYSKDGHNIGIEYDGSYFHKNKQELDANKENLLLSNHLLDGIVRVQEAGLTPRPTERVRYYELPSKQSGAYSFCELSDKEKEKVVSAVARLVGELLQDIKEEDKSIK